MILRIATGNGRCLCSAPFLQWPAPDGAARSACLCEQQAGFASTDQSEIQGGGSAAVHFAHGSYRRCLWVENCPGKTSTSHPPLQRGPSADQGHGLAFPHSTSPTPCATLGNCESCRTAFLGLRSSGLIPIYAMHFMSDLEAGPVGCDSAALGSSGEPRPPLPTKRAAAPGECIDGIAALEPRSDSVCRCCRVETVQHLNKGSPALPPGQEQPPTAHPRMDGGIQLKHSTCARVYEPEYSCVQWVMSLWAYRRCMR